MPGTEKKYFMFIPLDRQPTHATDFEVGAKRFNWEEKSGKKCTIVFLDDPDMNVFKMDGSLGKSATIYVRGHGQADKDYIIPMNNDDKFKEYKVTYTELCEMLIKRGLQTDFGGKIKFYNCCSAGLSKSKTGVGLDRSQQFACKCASYLRGKGYTKATYFGYIDPISGSYNTFHGAAHKYFVPDTAENQDKWRASRNRYQVPPEPTEVSII